MGGAPPQKKRKIPLRLVSIDERIEILKCDLAAQKTSTRLEKIRYNTLERQLQQTMKLKEKEELKGDFSNMYQNFEKDVLTPESSVFGDTSQCQSDLQSEASEEVVPNVLCLSNPMGENLCYQNEVTLAQDKQKLCFCKTTSHRCRVCQKLVCVECSVGDSEDEVKRFHPDCLRKAKKPTKTISSQESCLETIPEEMSEFPNLQLKPVQEEEPQQCEDTAEPFIFKKGSVSDVTYIGKKSQKEWNKESLYTTYILVPDELVHMVRMVPNSGATIEDLRCYLLKTLC